MFQRRATLEMEPLVTLWGVQAPFLATFMWALPQLYRVAVSWE